MYSKEKASQIKQDFWTRFGKYLALSLSADGEKINWINYKTGICSLNFRMDVINDKAYIGIEISHKDPQYAAEIYKQFEALSAFLEETLQETWVWQKVTENLNHQPISSISTVKEGCSIFKESDWPEIISFLKPRIIKLDEFWCNHRMIFEMIS